MFLTITTSKATLEQFQEVETFLHEFLPRLKQQPGCWPCITTPDRSKR